jgi:hypothetical protein
LSFVAQAAQAAAHVPADAGPSLATDLTALGAIFAALITAGVGLWQFRRQQVQTNKRPFLDLQLATLSEATDVAARLATETDPAAWKEARSTFWRLYWGRLALVEDPAVEGCMVTLGQLVPDGPISRARLPLDDLRNAALNLSHAARDLVRASWDADLAALSARDEALRDQEQVEEKGEEEED